MQMIGLPSAKVARRGSRRPIIVGPTPEAQPRLILTIAMLAVEDPTLLGPGDVQILAQAMLDRSARESTQ